MIIFYISSIDDYYEKNKLYKSQFSKNIIKFNNIEIIILKRKRRFLMKKINKKTKQKIIIMSCAILLVIVLILLAILITSKNKTEETNQLEESSANVAESQIVVDIGEEEIIDEIKVDNSFGDITGDTPYYIRVNYGAQVVNIYKKDEQGFYKVPFKAMVCSTGTYTPKSGTYSIPDRWKWGALQGDVYGQYVTKITGNILFHSVPYTRMRDPGSLEYWEFDKLGTDASLGCVRLKIEDAKWIYDNCKNGTKVEFYSSEDPGPLGKPSVMKISDYEDNLRNWDPTDPNPDNPWKGGSGITNANKENNNSDSNTQNTEQNPTENNSQEINQNEQLPTENTNPPVTEENTVAPPSVENSVTPPQAEEQETPSTSGNQNTTPESAGNTTVPPSGGNTTSSTQENENTYQGAIPNNNN